MATTAAEQLRNPALLLRNIGGLVKIHRTPKVVPWESIWSSTIPPEVIYATAGYCFKYEAALLYPLKSEQNDGVKFWRKQARRELLDHLHQAPQSRVVYRRLRQAHMIIPFDLRETLGERWQRFTNNISK